MTYSAGDIVTVDFPGITGIKRRPAVVLSSEVYHSLRPDVIVGLITTQTRVQCVTDYLLQDWASSGLRVASMFRCFIEIAVKPMLLSVGYKAVSEANKLFNFLLINIHLNSIP